MENITIDGVEYKLIPIEEEEEEEKRYNLKDFCDDAYDTFKYYEWTWLGKDVTSESILKNIHSKIDKLIENCDMSSITSGRIRVSKNEEEGDFHIELIHDSFNYNIFVD